MLHVFLTPRQALSSHLRQQMIWLYWLQDRDSMLNLYTINHPSLTMKSCDPLLLADGTLAQLPCLETTMVCIPSMLKRFWPHIVISVGRQGGGGDRLGKNVE